MAFDPYSIPGGAAAQIGLPPTQTEQPRAEGLTREQIMQAQAPAYEDKEPIPVYDSTNYPEYSPQIPESQVQEDGRIKHYSRGPDGNIYWLLGPPGSTREQALQIFPTMSEEDLLAHMVDPTIQQVAKEDYKLERFKLGFSEGDNITSNTFDYLTSHFPFLAEHYIQDAEGNTVLGHEFGDDFNDLTPQQRRDRMKQVKQARLQRDYADALAYREELAQRGEIDVAGLFGNLSKAIADPAAMVPVAGTAGKVKQAETMLSKVGTAAVTGGKYGAGFGGAYEVSQQLADTGAPTTGAELSDLAVDTVKGMAIAGAGGVVLGGLGGTVASIPGKIHAGRISAATKSPTKANKILEKYQERVLYEIANRKSGAEAHKAARDALGITTSDVYNLTRIGTYELHTPSTPSKAIELLGTRAIGSKYPGTYTREFIDSFVRPIDARLWDLNRGLYTASQSAEARSLHNMHKYHMETRPFTKVWRKFSTNDRRIIAQSLYNQDFKTVRNIVDSAQGKEATAAFDKMVNALKSLEKEAQDAGIKFDTISDYFPRYIKDLKGLQTYLSGMPEYKAAIDKIMTQFTNKKITENEAIKQINRLLQGNPKTTKTIGHAKRRKIVALNKEMMAFYDDPITSIDLHLRDMTSAIERRKLFGTSVKLNKDGSEDLGNTIGAYLLRSGMKPGSPELTEAKNILMARYGGGEVGSNRGLASLRAFTSGVALGNPISALLQLTDVGTVGWNKGMVNTLRGLPKASLETMKGTLGLESTKLNADTMGWMLEMAQELDTGGFASAKVRKIADNLMRYGGFKLMDRFGKNITIQASIQRAQRQLRTREGTQKFLNKWGTAYSGQDMNQLISDLKSKKITDLVKQYVFCEVTETQPISRMQMPEMYLRSPNGRIAYQFKTWSLKQIDLVRTRVLRNLFSLDPKKQMQGAKELALYITYVGGGGVTVREMQNFILGRDSRVNNPKELRDEVAWTIAGNFFLNRYDARLALEKGDETALLTNLMPPSLGITAGIALNAGRGLAGNPDGWKKVANSTGFGRMLYNIVGPGAEEYNDRLIKQRIQQ